MWKIKLLSIFLLFTILLASCYHSEIPEDHLMGTWKFVSVVNSKGDTLKEVIPGDFMQLYKDQTFYYILQKENIQSKGTWSYADSILTYKYDVQGAVNLIRKYRVINLTDSVLLMDENGVDYKFRRAENQQ